MPLIEPVPNEPAAIADVDGERALLVADYHAGVEAALRYERGVQVPSRAEKRRESLLYLLELTEASRLVVLGDLMHSIGDPGGAERGELEVLFESMPPVDVTVVKGNHDGAIESWLGEGSDVSPGANRTGTARGMAGTDDPGHNGEPAVTRGSASGDEPGEENWSSHLDDPASEDRAADPASVRPDDGTGVASLDVTRGEGVRIGDVGVCHGHSWPSPEVLGADVVCTGHEHPCVRLEDEVGGSRVERAWLRGRLDVAWVEEQPAYEDADLPAPDEAPELVVVPAFNDLVGGTWVNVTDQSFLSPFLPEGLTAGEAYLLDGTRLGPYDGV